MKWARFNGDYVAEDDRLTLSVERVREGAWMWRVRKDAMSMDWGWADTVRSGKKKAEAAAEKHR